MFYIVLKELKNINSNNYNYFIKQIIIIQKIFRGYLIKKYILIPSSKYQTKQWRKNRKWYINGKYNECEKYQYKYIELITKYKLIKTNERFNIEKNIIMDNKNPNKHDDGYEWSKNFDGKIYIKSDIYYFNLKFVCDNGGAQTRTLREVYHFIKSQIF